jgi:hypothetical protein
LRQRCRSLGRDDPISRRPDWPISGDRSRHTPWPGAAATIRKVAIKASEQLTLNLKTIRVTGGEAFSLDVPIAAAAGAERALGAVIAT